MKNLLQEYLQFHSLKFLQRKFAIKIKRHPKYSNLIQFKYDQINSPMEDLMVQQCRGLILDEADNWKVIAWPFNKFFNLGETNAAELDWDSAKVYEKLDGSLMILYFYGEKWNVATGGSPDASGSLPYKKDQTFAELFEELFWEPKDIYEVDYLKLDTSMTYMFEMCSPYNQIVVKHEKPTLTLIGMRSNVCGEEFNDLIELKPIKLEAIDAQWEHGLVKDIVDNAEQLNPWEQEGYIVVDKHFNRVKVKSPKYVALHHSISNMTKTKLVEMLKIGELEEVAANFSEWKAEVWRLHDEFLHLKARIISFYEGIRRVESQKEFALEAVKKPWSAILFMMRKAETSGKSFSVNEILLNQRTEILEKWLENE